MIKYRVTLPCPLICPDCISTHALLPGEGFQTRRNHTTSFRKCQLFECSWQEKMEWQKQQTAFRKDKAWIGLWRLHLICTTWTRALRMDPLLPVFHQQLQLILLTSQTLRKSLQIQMMNPVATKPAWGQHLSYTHQQTAQSVWLQGEDMRPMMAKRACHVAASMREEQCTNNIFSAWTSSFVWCTGMQNQRKEYEAILCSSAG